MKRPLFIIKWMGKYVKGASAKSRQRKFLLLLLTQNVGDNYEFSWHRVCFWLLFARVYALRSFMARLEGKKPNAGAIIIGAIIFSLVAAGLFFAFRPVPEPTDAGLSNSTSATNEDNGGSSSDANATSDNATDGESSNSLTTILTPLPLATPTVAPQSAPTAQTDEAASASDNSAPAPTAATAPVAPAANSSPTPNSL